MSGTPETLVKERIGTIVSPWVPRTKPMTSRGATPSSRATNVRNRAVSSVPDSPKTRAAGNPVTFRNQ